jgi:hypothetical protein
VFVNTSFIFCWTEKYCFGCRCHNRSRFVVFAVVVVITAHPAVSASVVADQHSREMAKAMPNTQSMARAVLDRPPHSHPVCCSEPARSHPASVCVSVCGGELGWLRLQDAEPSSESPVSQERLQATFNRVTHPVHHRHASCARGC